ncbi:hypothetical protein BU17DRAFT_96872 [Hysterangium stoloniferum]|nr:hypothetical protein BU17DRAFT_96872 [Hysterangium stoloniferum]
MGSAQSILTLPNLLAAVLFIGVVGSVWRTNTTSLQRNDLKAVGSKKGKKKKALGRQDTEEAFKTPDNHDASPVVTSRSIPGGSPESGADTSLSDVSKPVKEKKKKGKKAAASGNPSESVTPVAGPSRPSTAPHAAADESWTRIETRKKSTQSMAASDAGITTATSVDDDVSEPLNKTGDEGSKRPSKTLAEKMLPKGRKTAVDDMLESSQYPELSRVMRVTHEEQPATGFSWGDYEDANDVRGVDADGEDDGEWGIVKSRGRAKHTQSTSSSGVLAPPSRGPETLTKKQKQHAARRDAVKTAKADIEKDRLARQEKHRREAEKARIEEQYGHSKGGRRKVAGGMNGYVSAEGKLVFE